MFGELPPPPPRACFGRNELIENIVCLAENLTPIALIGAGGIGKTSIALTILHDNRIEQQFGDNRRFIRCDQFPATLVHFLCRLSKVIGAGVDNPEDLAPLRPFLSSKKMFIILDNAESVLDPQGTNAQEIYAVVEELSQFKTISLCITSRITTVPRHCKRPGIPALSMGAARDIFYNIYDDSGRSGVINDLLQQLDFHALSITLLATTASHNVWDHDRLAQEWDARRTQVLRTDYNESLAATIELSLSSLTFQELGPDARDLLGIIAFFPQGIDENNLDWLFPTVSNTKNIFDKFCVLSLTYRTNGFITMLAPLRDYLVPEDREPSPLLYTTKSCYFRRLSIRVDPDKPSFEAARWITSEDVNVEHLLDVFTRADANADDVWDACCNFMEHLYWHKSRLVVLGPKIEGLPDDYPHKPKCLLQLSLLLGSVGNLVEEKRLLIHTLKLWSEQGDDFHIARTLRFLAETNGRLGLFTEGIEQAKEALTIYERLGNVSERAAALHRLSWLFYDDKKLEAAEETASRLINLLPEKGKQFQVCQCHCVLGNICRSKGETQKAIDHFVAALGIASSFNWHDQLFWNHYSLAELLSDEDKFDDAHVHIGRAKSHAINDPYLLGRAMELEAQFLHKQCRLKAAKLEALRAADVYERLGATKYLGRSRAFLQWIEEETSIPVNSDGPDFDGNCFEAMPLSTPTNSPFSAGGTLLRITNPTSG